MILRGRPIAPGQAHGHVLASRTSLSFLGGVDPATGRVVDPQSDVRGKRLRRSIFAFAHGAGSTVGSYVLYGLAKRGSAPAALVAQRADTVVATGAVLAGIPMVDHVDTEAVETGDVAVVDGTDGLVTVPDVREKAVVTAFLQNRGRILFLRRSQRVTTFRGRWSAISGYLEGIESPLRRARTEISEETGIHRAKLVRAGRPHWVREGRIAFRIHPFLFEVAFRDVRLDWENVEARWLPPKDVATLPTVPRLGDVLLEVLGTQGADRPAVGPVPVTSASRGRRRPPARRG